MSTSLLASSGLCETSDGLLCTWIQLQSDPRVSRHPRIAIFGVMPGPGIQLHKDPGEHLSPGTVIGCGAKGRGSSCVAMTVGPVT